MPYAVRVDKIKRGATRIKMYLVIHTVYTAILRSTDKASGELREKKGVVNRVVTPYCLHDRRHLQPRTPVTAAPPVRTLGSNGPSHRSDAR